MDLVPEVRESYLKLVLSKKGRWRLLDWLRAVIVRLASKLANYASLESGPRVTVPLLQQGGVGVALSVLYSPFDEFDVTKPYGAPPSPDYFATLLRQVKMVEQEIDRHHRGAARVCHDPAELEAALRAGEVALVHCVEGGFHLGATPQQVQRNVAELARRGVAYVILAHLFWRSVATNRNGLPFLSDRLYHFLFREPDIGLSVLGQAAVRAMAREGVLIDLSHASDRAIEETLDLLDELDPARAVPVVVSHSGYRFGRSEYNLTAEMIERVASRDGVVGLILADHHSRDGLRRRPTRALDDSLAILFAHLDRIREITGSHRHAAIGSDLDGFIKH